MKKKMMKSKATKKKTMKKRNACVLAALLAAVMASSTPIITLADIDFLDSGVESVQTETGGPDDVYVEDVPGVTPSGNTMDGGTNENDTVVAGAIEDLIGAGNVEADTGADVADGTDASDQTDPTDQTDKKDRDSKDITEDGNSEEIYDEQADEVIYADGLSDDTADVETTADWEATLPDELTGVYADDLIAVAVSQLGYCESTTNYRVNEDGKHKGYTRYGAWYGNPYGDWCAMFVSFCLHYAEIPDDEFPEEASCQAWVETLEDEDLYESVDSDYEPVAGDIIFFNNNSTDGKDVDHVGIIEAIEDDEITTIEGNSSNMVKRSTYDVDSDLIVGFGVLPVEEEEDYGIQTLATTGTALYQSDVPSTGTLELSDGDYYLAESITAHVVISSATVSLDLNGYTLTGTTNSVIRVEHGNFTLMDESTSQFGMVTGGTSSGIRVLYDDSIFIMESGTVANASSMSYGGGVRAEDGAAVVINGGTITNNSADYGGGIASCGPVTINGGTISYNSASSFGGGIQLYSSASSSSGYHSGSLEINGGYIEHNTAQRGGGVEGAFTMNGGTIQYNSAAGTDSRYDGGGGIDAIWVHINGGEIVHNESANKGGGIMISYGRYVGEESYIAGGVTISDNSAIYGGGVCGDYGTDLTIYSGVKISSNTASYGGGVYMTPLDISWGEMAYPIVTMEGGSISNNTATVDGGGVYGEEYCTFNLSGGTISNNSASSGSGGGIYDAYTFTMTGGIIGGNDEDGGNVAHSNGGGVYVTGEDATFNMSGGSILNNNTNATSGGLFGGAGVCLCDGCIFQMSGTASISYNRSSHGGTGVSVIDSSFVMKGGSIDHNTGGNSSGGAGVTISGENASFEMDGGSISENEVNHNGGGVYLYGGATFIMNDGTISNNISMYGGGVAIQQSSSFIMNGGTISANESTYGGGVSAWDSFVMNDGLITGNTATYGGGIEAFTYAASTHEIILNGGSITDNTAVYGGGAVVDDSTLFINEKATIQNNNADYGGGVFVANDGVYDAGALQLEGGTISGNIALNGGGVYDEGTFTMTKGTITENQAVCEHDDSTVDSDAYGGGVYVAGNGTFTMLDGSISYNKTDRPNIEIQGSFTNGFGGGVCLEDSAYFAMTGGTIQGNSSSFGGGVCAYSNNTFVMDGGSIIENTVDGWGGGIELESLSTCTINGESLIANNEARYGGGILLNGSNLTINDGTISGNQALWGGGIYSYTVSDSSFLYTGGTITKNTAEENGGGIYQGGSGALKMSGGAISTNNAVNGGGVYINGIFEMTDGTIGNENSAQYGGGVYDAGTFIMTGGTIGGSGTDDGNSADMGGGVFVTGEGNSFSMTDGCEISGNYAFHNGGGVYGCETCTITIEGGTISKNSAVNYGGGVSIIGGTGFQSGGSIIQNTAGSYGGGIFFEEDAYYLTGGNISENNADYGGGFYLATHGIPDDIGDDSTAEISGKVVISNNTATYWGGGIFIWGTAATLTMGYEVTVSGNNAVLGGGVYVGDNGTFNMTGGTIGGKGSNDANTASNNGGGVYVDNGYWIPEASIFNMTGGTITGNSSTSDGGGVYQNGAFNISGNPVVTGNTSTASVASDKSDNVYVPTNNSKVITLAGELTGAAGSIGVMTYDKPTYAKAVQFTDAANPLYAASYTYFTSDDTRYYVHAYDEGQWDELALDCTVTIKVTDHSNYLNNTEFTLMYNGLYYSLDENGNVVWTEAPYTFTVPRDGLTLNGLLVGDYVLTETKTTGGHILPDSSITFSIDGDGKFTLGTVQVTNEGDDPVTLNGSEGAGEITVVNITTLVMPNAATRRAIPFAVIGLAVVLAGGAAVGIRRRRMRA